MKKPVQKHQKWEYRKADIREDVREQIPEHWHLEVYEVISGDTGNKYWVQLLREENGLTISICNCRDGLFKVPLSILVLDTCCKHADRLIIFLEGGDAKES